MSPGRARKASAASPADAGARGAGGAIVLVATPIGHLGDLSPRAVQVLRDADVICCEDTRRTRALLSAAGVPAAGRLRALHAHNEAARTPELLAAAADGRTVALVTDAGTPAVSDPGARLVAAAARAGVRVTIVPGPSAALAALVVSGLPTDRFCVEGFLPRSGGARRRRLDGVVSDPRTTVLFESPQRLGPTLSELAARAPGREVAVCRELTKVHEEVWRGSLSAAAQHFSSRSVRGEVAIVVAGFEADAAISAGAEPSEDEVARAAAALSSGRSVRDAADMLVQELGTTRRRAYAAAVAARHRGAHREGLPDEGGGRSC
ncbi:MAG: 16S rRNA (cytidine(1402)-2'-O)-methyltransferase [Actinomycetota bacterium]|nr:16S rRNA (cytidine(1402)-2'-O)-methyltransferase [Actinomycetota bacterium]